MKIHKVKTPFMTREGQFERGKHTLVVGIEVNALKKAGEYRVYIGNNKKDYYDITYAEALDIYRKHGSNALTKRGVKRVFILPVNKFRHGVSKWDPKEAEKKEVERAKINEPKQIALL